jgi:broad specificity phosphatase PhoE
MAQPETLKQIWLIRHGETEWSLSGAHTGLTDLPLTANGELQATEIAHKLSGQEFALVLTSPLQRARETCRLAGYAKAAQLDSNLLEWDYGDYEGLSTPQIRLERPGWNLWRDGVPRGETVEQVAARTQLVIERCRACGGNAALFAHGHVLRILTATWLGLPADAGRLFALSTATISVLGCEREQQVISRWNQA